jgi:hypothetical protein
MDFDQLDKAFDAEVGERQGGRAPARRRHNRAEGGVIHTFF